jgi:transketolase
VVFEDDAPFHPGKINVLRPNGRDIALFGNGVLLPRLLAAAEALAARGVAATVVEVHTVKPLDVEGVTRILIECGAAVTAEDHNIIGGLGSAVMEAAAENAPVPIWRIGLRDRFPGSGPPDALLDMYGMGVGDIVEAAVATIARKGRRP